MRTVVTGMTRRRFATMVATPLVLGVARSGRLARRRLGPLGYDLVLLVLGWIAYTASAIIFCKRDLPAPL